MLLWHARVHAWSFHGAGADRRGDGQVFWNVPTGPDTATTVPSIRAVMLRDGIEDREYLTLLAEVVERFSAIVETHEEKTLLETARNLVVVPDDLVMTQWKKLPRICHPG